MKCTARAGAGAVNLARRTPVRPSSILVVGATETLGRQIVRRALDEGHDVRCLVRPRPTPADFLRDWRATVINFKEPIKKVDWEGKAMGIQKFVFDSIHNCDKHPEVPLMEIKYCTKKFPQDSCINHVIIRLCGFMQGIAYIRREISIGNRCPHKNCIHGHPDVAPLTFIGSRNEKVNGKLLTFAGPHAWTTQEVCGARGKYNKSPVSVLRVTCQLTRLFECTNDVADRLAFSEVLVIFVELNEFLKQRLSVDSLLPLASGSPLPLSPSESSLPLASSDSLLPLASGSLLPLASGSPLPLSPSESSLPLASSDSLLPLASGSPLPLSPSESSLPLASGSPLPLSACSSCSCCNMTSHFNFSASSAYNRHIPHFSTTSISPHFSTTSISHLDSSRK